MACRFGFVLLAAALLAGCGSVANDDKGTPVPARAQAVGERSAGSVVQFANCDDWNRGSRGDKLATIAELRDQLTAQSSRSTASPLSDERAFKVLQKTCTATDYAGSLRLYKLYARVQGFAPLAP